MVLKNIWLKGFRNHDNFVVDFSTKQDDAITLIVGQNGSGKSNLLEAIYLLAHGKSFHAGKIAEMVGWDGEVGRVKGLLSSQMNNDQFSIINSNEEVISRGEPMARSTEGDSASRPYNPVELEVTVTRGEVNEEKAPLKTMMVNGVNRSLSKFAGNLKVVLFSPGDMRLIEGSPSRRRDYMDEVLGLVFNEYRRARLSYEKGVRRRNRVLAAIKEGVANRNQLFFWDRLLIKEGNVLTDYRQRLVKFLNVKEWIPHQFEITSSFANATADSQGFKSVRDDKADIDSLSALSIEYDSSVISEQRLQKYAREEVGAKVTLVGPHRDDFIVRFKSQDSPELQMSSGQARVKDGIDLSVYGSRGQQRMAVLWLKLGALAYIEKETGEKPVLLLDDIFSELDHQHRDLVLKVIKTTQTIITAADEHLVEEVEGKRIRL